MGRLPGMVWLQHIKIPPANADVCMLKQERTKTVTTEGRGPDIFE